MWHTRSSNCLIESYIFNRQRFVSINNSASSLKSISIGVLQGSILDPLLFLIYVNDLTNATFCQPRLFADDTCLALNNSSLNALEVNCNCELRRLHNWCDANELQINPEKSINQFSGPAYPWGVAGAAAQVGASKHLDPLQQRIDALLGCQGETN